MMEMMLRYGIATRLWSQARSIMADLIRTIKRLITEAKDKTVTAIEEKIEQKKEEHYVRTGI